MYKPRLCVDIPEYLREVYGDLCCVKLRRLGEIDCVYARERSGQMLGSRSLIPRRCFVVRRLGVERSSFEK